MSADIQRLVNLYPVALEPPGDVKFIFESIPGLKTFAYLTGEARGGIETNDRVFVAFGSNFCEVMAGGTFVSRGTLNTSTGPVSMDYGLFQVALVDGAYGYVYRFATGVMSQITSDAFYGSPVVRFFKDRFLFIRPGTQQFYWTQIDDATDLDALDFASAESQADNLVTLEIDHEEAYLMGTKTIEVWFATDTDQVFQKSQGSGMEVGCMAAHSVKKLDNSIYWLGRDKNGSCVVYRAQGHQPIRVSTHEVEEALQASTDPTAAVAYTYQDKGLTFYAINAPGMSTTWTFEVAGGQWAERNDLDGVGQLKAHRMTMSLFAFDTHLGGAADGYLYELDQGTYKNGTDPLVRELITAREFDPEGRPMFFSRFWARMKTGGAAQGDDPQVELSWTDNAGKSWTNPVLRSLGRVGQSFMQVLWTRVGGPKTFDRAWKIRFSGNAPFSIRNWKSRFTVGNG